MLHVSVLGPIRVERDGEVVRIPGGLTAALLVRLALDAGTAVRADRLVEDLWGDAAVTTDRNTLQSKISRLRRAIGADVIRTVDAGYVLAVDPDAVDALAVVQDASRASRLLADGDPIGAAERSARALERFRGEIFPGILAEWAEPHRARLEEARGGLRATAFDARLRLGEGADLIVDLETAVAEHPFQEGLWELLATALYRAGRQADALAALRRVRDVLAEELGLEPGPGLQRLEVQILRHDDTIQADDAPPGTNLPSLADDLVGRAEERTHLVELVRSTRLVVVVGAGGIGKTALAIDVGRHLPPVTGGIWLVRLESASSATEVVDAIVAALGVTGGEAALAERLRTSPTVVILDNCEHVADAVADLAARLLDVAPGLRLLATSQVRLGIDGEVVVELGPPSLPDAVELFDRRSTAQGRGRGSATDQAVSDLCASLDRLPLAIELAAARTRTLSVADITRRLDDRFAVLSDPSSRRPERRRALRSTIAWSYDLLFPDDQRGLWALSTFAGGATIEAVEHVLGALGVPPSAAIDVVDRLATRSLLITEADAPGDPEATGPDGRGLRPSDERVRYRLLDSIRAFAADAAEDAGEAERARGAHAAWFERAAKASTAGVRSAEQARFLALARVERANIDAALEWSAEHVPNQALRMAAGFGWAWIVLGDSRGAARLLRAIDAAGSGADRGDRIDALLLAGWIEASLGDLGRARAHVDEGRRRAAEVGDAEREARAAYYLAYVVSHEGRWQEGLELTAASAAGFDRLDRPWDQAANALFAARAAISAGDGDQARLACAAVEHWLGQVDDPWLMVRGEATLGELARIEHRFDDAVRHLLVATDTSRRLGFRQTEAYQVSSLGRAQCQAGDHESGAATLAVAVRKAEATGDPRLAALARVHLGRVRRALGQDHEARVELELADAFHRSVGGGEQAALGTCLLAALDAAALEVSTPHPSGVEREAIEARLTDALAEARARDDASVEVFALDALARSAAADDDQEGATSLLAEADARMAAASHFISERDRVDARAVRFAAR